MKARRFLMMLLSLVALTAAGAEDKYLQEFSGDCSAAGDGNNVTYSWNPTTRTMTFSGT